MDKETINEIAELIIKLRKTANYIPNWKERYITRAIIIKILSDTNHNYTLEEVIEVLKEVKVRG